MGLLWKKSYFLLDLALLILKDTLLMMGKHVLYEREFMFKTVFFADIIELESPHFLFKG